MDIQESIEAQLQDFEAGCDRIYYPDQKYRDINKKRVLCVIPNLDLNGAQVVFDEILELIREIKDGNYYILSPTDGEYREYYLEKGITICIKQYSRAGEEFRRALRNVFSMVFLNTALVHHYLMYYINTDVPVYWWIHESEESLRRQCEDMPNPYLLSSNIHLFGVTDRVKFAFKNIYGYTTDILHMVVRDRKGDFIRHKEPGHVTFVIPAAYIPIKGQDILLQAIVSLPDSYRNKARFVFCGYKVDGQEEYYNKILELSAGIECVEHIGRLDKERMYQLYADCDCVIASSRLDSTPTTIVEAMMFEKLTIVSDRCGISEYMSDCINGFVFGAVLGLMKRLMLVIEDCASLGKIASAGRMIWERQFSTEAIMDKLKAVFQN